MRIGERVVFVDSAHDHVAAMRAEGISITGPIAEFRVPVTAICPDQLDGPYRRVLLCVKAQDTESATKMLAPHLAPDGYIVSVQNGLNENIIATIVGVERTIGCFVNFGADYLSPGIIQYSGHGAVIVGEVTGVITDRLRTLHQLFTTFDERARLSDNIFGYLWSKEAYGALLFATALTDESIADCLALQRFQKLFISLAREVLHVATSRNIKCEPFDGFSPDSFLSGSTDEQAAHSLSELVEHNRRSVKTHSGIWRDLAIRKRRTEIDAQLGAVVREADACGLKVPITVRLIQLIHEVETGSRQRGLSTLAALAETA